MNKSSSTPPPPWDIMDRKLRPHSLTLSLFSVYLIYRCFQEGQGDHESQLLHECVVLVIMATDTQLQCLTITHINEILRNK